VPIICKFSRNSRFATALMVAAVLVLAGCSSGESGQVIVVGSIGSATLSPTTTATSDASPDASSQDGDDESAVSAGASFVETATGAPAPVASGMPDDRLPGEPDPLLTPGALNPVVTQATIHSTICVSGWTATIRPPVTFTNSLKIKQIGQYGYTDKKSASYEEDHLISLELGGAPTDPSNLWPEPYVALLADGRSTGAHTKDAFETKLKTQVCAGTIALAAAQVEIGDHWVHAYYGISFTNSTASTVTP
jgi:hypothetical protein